MFNFVGREFDVITFGEVIMRLSSPVGKVIVQDTILERSLGGAELNVAIGISSLGGKTSFLSKVPNHDLGVYSKKMLNQNNVNCEYLIYDDSPQKRLAIYYYEYGASPRKPTVIYDRYNSSFQNLYLNEINENIFNKSKIFHTSGISLGLCENSKNLTKELIKKFKENNTIISFDVNFRRNLWGNEENARKEIEKILPYIDILFASEETLRKMFKQTGSMKEIMKNFSKEHKINLLISTQRTVISPKCHNFNSIIYSSCDDKYYEENPYNNIDIVDRIGSGDSYVAGILYGLTTHNDITKALEYGNCLGAIKNTVFGDNSIFSKEYADSIIENHKNGSNSEMNR